MTEHTTPRTSDVNRLPHAGAGSVWDLSPGFPVLRPAASGVSAAFTTRLGGVSSPPFDALNLSVVVGDERASVIRNRAIAGAAVGRTEIWSRVKQVHGATVLRAPDPGSGPRPEADGLHTDDPARTIAVTAADCVPVLLAAPGRVAAAHAGWRGLVAGIVERTAEAVGAVDAWAGPAIGPCCFEVGAEVVEAFRERFGPEAVADARHVDLWAAYTIAARRAGVERAYAARICTSCHPQLFFSHRRDRGRTGRQGLVAALEGP